MCIDYTSLKKACQKDEYPLPRICQIVDFITFCELLSFLDTYSGYHQISLAVDDKEKRYNSLKAIAILFNPLYAIEAHMSLTQVNPTC
jgi:hypothetical protein